jgi:hypothetical protein
MTKGPYTKVRELIAPKIDQANDRLVDLCRKAYPRIPLKDIKMYVGRAAWELRKKGKQHRVAVAKH